MNEENTGPAPDESKPPAEGETGEGTETVKSEDGDADKTEEGETNGNAGAQSPLPANTVPVAEPKEERSQASYDSGP